MPSGIKVKVNKDGNSLALRIPAKMARQMQVQAGAEVEIWLEGNIMIVKPEGISDENLLRTGARIISTYLDGEE